MDTRPTGIAKFQSGSPDSGNLAHFLARADTGFSVSPDRPGKDWFDLAANHGLSCVIRPIRHTKEELVLAYIVVSFLAIGLWKTLSQLCEKVGFGSVPAESWRSCPISAPWTTYGKVFICRSPYRRRIGRFSGFIFLHGFSVV